MLLDALETSCGPALIVVDDLHLVDPESLQAILFALRRLHHPTLALLTARSDQVGHIPPGLYRLTERQGTQLCIDGLSLSDIRALALAVTGSRISHSSAKRLQQHTGGNPLHLRTLMQELSYDQIVSGDPLPAPRSFALLIQSSLSGLSADAMAVAQASAILGDHASLEQIAVVASVPEPLPALQELHETRLARTTGIGIRSTVALHHPLIRAAIQDDIGPQLKAVLHQRAATVVTGERALQHRVVAATRPDVGLVAELRMSAANMQATAQWRGAARSLRDAARLSSDSDERDRLILSAVDCLLTAGDVVGATRLQDDMATIPESGRWLVVQSRLAWMRGEHAAAKDFGLRAWKHAGEFDTSTCDSVAALLTEQYLTMDDAGTGLEWANRVLESPWLTPQDCPATVGARATVLGMLGRTNEGLASLADIPDDPTRLPPHLRDRARHRGTLRMWSDDLAGAITDLKVATGEPDFASSPYCVVAMAVLMESYFRSGLWDRCLELFEQSNAFIEDAGQLWFASFVHGRAALVTGARGEWETAENRLRQAAHEAQKIPTPAQSHYLAESIVHVAACQQDWPSVITLSEVMARGKGAARQPGIFQWPIWYAEALVATGDVEAADRWLSELEPPARSMGHRSRLAGIARARGNLACARRSPGVARAAYREAVELSAGVDVLSSVMAWLAYGRFLRRRGERRAAVDALTQAHHRAAELLARPFVERCVTELAAAGATDHAAQPSRPDDELTAQERAVSDLACSGLTTREIAKALVLSSKTIEFHIRNIYRKVGVHSRSQLIVSLNAEPGRPDPWNTTTR